MPDRKSSEKHLLRHPVSLLFALWLTATAIRFILALLTSRTPSLNIDEFLYTGLARSIGTGDGLLFRGQTADYGYPAYPLFLAPVYMLFPAGSDYFRILQFWSILLIQTSVFPIYGLARELPESTPGQALKIAAITLLLPDFIFGEVLLSECLIYPVFFTTAWLGIRQIRHSDIRLSLLAGVCTALLYETKPGQIVLPLVLLAGNAFTGPRTERKKRILFSIAGIGLAALLIVICGLCTGVGTSFSIYGKQVYMTFRHTDRFFRGLLLYPFCFLLGCGGCMLWPVMNLKKLRYDWKHFLCLILIAAALTVIGTSWSINRYEYASDTIHLRYIAMYIPLMILMTTAVPAENTTEDGTDKRARKKQRRNPGKHSLILPLTVAAWCILCVICNGTSFGGTYIYALMSMALFADPAMNSGLALLLLIAATAGICALCCILYKRKRNPMRLCLTIAAALMLINNIVCYSHFASSPGNNIRLRNAGEEAAEAINGREYLYVHTDGNNIAYSTLAVNSHQNASFVLMNDLFNRTYENAGKYKPFVPEMEMRGTLCRLPTADTNVIVMDNSVFPLVKCSDTVKLRSFDEYLMMAEIPAGERWVDSMMANISANVLEKGDTGVLVLFDEKLMNAPLTIRIHIGSPMAATMMITSGAETYTRELAAGKQWIEATFSDPQAAYNFMVNDCNISVFGYETIPAAM